MPFGIQMENRHGREISSYRYSFQGQEGDPEIKGKGNSYNYKYRMHDPRLGRFFAVDPLTAKYPHNSPYAFSENRVLDAIELEGLESLSAHDGLVQAVDPQRPIENGEHGGLAGTFIAEYKTSKGRSVYATYAYISYRTYDFATGESITPDPVFPMDRDPQEFEGQPVDALLVTYIMIDAVPKFEVTNWKVGINELNNYYTNCHGHSLGISGNVQGAYFSATLKDNYEPVDGPEIGAIAAWGEDHSFLVVGQNENGDWIYSSNWLLEDPVVGTMQEITEQMHGHNAYMSDEDGNILFDKEFTEEDFEWYVPKDQK